MKKRIRTSMSNALALLVLGAGSTWAASPGTPEIDSASQIFTISPSQLEIQGSGFGTLRPIVVLGGTPLFILSFTDTVVFASVPQVVPPGTYTLVLTPGASKSNPSAPFDVTIGAVGPAGATGPAGPQGPAGPAGSTGATGPAGSSHVYAGEFINGSCGFNTCNTTSLLVPGSYLVQASVEIRGASNAQYTCYLRHWL
jgi:hypothetical protein